MRSSPCQTNLEDELQLRLMADVDLEQRERRLECEDVDDSEED